ncbi:beta-propeller fold lactonase family protein [bacterium]|nr:beta-propeller fold lactonase family protein [bacterium]
MSRVSLCAWRQRNGFVRAATQMLAVAALATLLTGSMAMANDDLWVLVGTYTRGNEGGINVLRFDPQTATLTKHSVARIDNPSFLAVHPSEKFVYSVAEVATFDGKRGGAVAAFSFDAKAGTLTKLNHESTIGAGPCHVVVDQTGRYVLAANYGGGSVVVLPIEAEGKVGPATCFVQHVGSSVDPRRQKEPHAHSINLDPTNQFAVAADLGVDKVFVYRLNGKNGTLTDAPAPFGKVAPGSGPRHFAFHPSGLFGYVINEIALTVTAFTFDSTTGELSEIQTISTLPPGVEKQGSTAEVRVHPSGRFLYGSNRGHDSIVVYSIDQDTGRLTYVENEPTQGSTPRNFFVEPSGQFLFAENQQSGTIAVLKIDQQTGALSPTGNSIEVPSPVCIRTVPVQD